MGKIVFRAVFGELIQLPEREFDSHDTIETVKEFLKENLGGNCYQEFQLLCGNNFIRRNYRIYLSCL